MRGRAGKRNLVGSAFLGFPGSQASRRWDRPKENREGRRGREETTRLGVAGRRRARRRGGAEEAAGEAPDADGDVDEVLAELEVEDAAGRGGGRAEARGPEEARDAEAGVDDAEDT